MTGGIRHRLAIAVIFCWAIPAAGQCPAVSAPTARRPQSPEEVPNDEGYSSRWQSGANADGGG